MSVKFCTKKWNILKSLFKSSLTFGQHIMSLGFSSLFLWNYASKPASFQCLMCCHPPMKLCRLAKANLQSQGLPKLSRNILHHAFSPNACSNPDTLTSWALEQQDVKTPVSWGQCGNSKCAGLVCTSLQSPAVLKGKLLKTLISIVRKVFQQELFYEMCNPQVFIVNNILWCVYFYRIRKYLAC